MKRITTVLFLLSMVVAPSALAQVVVAGDYSPVDVGYGDNFSSGGSGPLSCNFVNNGSCVAYQAFSLASGTYINGIKLGFVELPNPIGGSGFFQITIWSGAIGGPLVFNIGEPWTFPPISADQVFFIDINIPANHMIWLPHGNYYIGVQGGVQSGCTIPGSLLTCGLEWAPNQNGSAEVGIVGQGFYNDQHTTTGIVPLGALPGTNGTFAFELFTPRVNGRPHGGGVGQIIRLVAGPILVGPGVPVEAQLGFLDMNGNPIGPSSTVTINPGETQSLDLNVSNFVSQLGQRIEVQPQITLVPNAAGTLPPLTQLSATVQVLDALSGFGSLLDPLAQPGAAVPPLVAQGLAGGETMRFNAVAGAANPCVGQLSFGDQNGNPVGPSMPLNLTPGAGTSLDLNANALGLRLGQSIEVLPILTVTPPLTAGTPLSSVCQASVEVFDHVSGRTWTYQSSMQSASASQ